MADAGKKRVLTGSRPTGSPHLGNYFGAFKPLIDLQQDYDLFFFLADFHALNEVNSAEVTRANSLELMATLLALGLDPEKGLAYSQSAVPQVCELSWILSCHAAYGKLTRAHSFKDAQAKGVEVNMGLFNYPVLMAADILLFDADVVPVGKDQKQHIEMTRDFASSFNHHYGEVFKLPEPKISEAVAVVPGTDGEKMSKSKANVVSIFATDKVWKKQIMSIVTAPVEMDDPKNPDTCNIIALYKLFATEEEMSEMGERYRAGGYGFGHAKLALLEKVKEAFTGPRDRFQDWSSRPDDIIDVIRVGSRKARERAEAKLDAVQKAVGTLGRPF